MTHYICPKCPQVVEESDVYLYSEMDVNYFEYQCPACNEPLLDMNGGLDKLLLMVRRYMDDSANSGGLIATQQQRQALNVLADCASGEYA